MKPQTMEETIACVEHMVSMFFRNEFHECQDMAVNMPDRDQHPYLVITPCYIQWVFAIITLEQQHIDDCMEKIAETTAMCNQNRKNLGISGWFMTPAFNEYTDEEAHLEVLTGEVNFMATIMTLLAEQSLMAFIKLIGVNLSGGV